MGARVKDQSRVKELEKIINEEIFADLPDLTTLRLPGQPVRRLRRRAPQRQHSPAVPGPGGPGGCRIELGEKLLREALPEAHVRANPVPGAGGAGTATHPQRPQDQSEVGWARRDLGVLVRAMGDGLYVGEHFDGEKRMNVILRARPWESPEQLASIPVATPAGTLVPMSELVDIERTVGPSQLRRIDSRRTVTLDIRPPEDMSLEHILGTMEGSRSSPSSSRHAGGWQHPLRRQRQRPDPGDQIHGQQFRPGPAGAVPADGGPVPLPQGQRCWWCWQCRWPWSAALSPCACST